LSPRTRAEKAKSESSENELENLKGDQTKMLDVSRRISAGCGTRARLCDALEKEQTRDLLP